MVEVSLYVDDQGKLSIEVDQNASNEMESPESQGGSKPYPIEDINQACQAIKQVYAEIMKGVKPEQPAQPEAQAMPAAQEPMMPSPADEEAAAMQAGFSGKR